MRRVMSGGDGSAPGPGPQPQSSIALSSDFQPYSGIRKPAEGSCCQGSQVSLFLVSAPKVGISEVPTRWIFEIVKCSKGLMWSSAACDQVIQLTEKLSWMRKLQVTLAHLTDGLLATTSSSRCKAARLVRRRYRRFGLR